MTIDKYIRFLRDLKYDLLIPPHGSYTQMTPKQAKESFEFFMEHLPERVEYLRNRCAQDLRIPIDKLDYSPESLILVWKWFLKTARTEKTPKEELEKMKEGAKIFGESYINREQLSVITHFIIRDIAMYVGQCFVLNYPNMYWSYKPTKVKNDVTGNQPMIVGFHMTYNGKEGDISFFPIHMISVQAGSIIRHSKNEKDLYNLFIKWVQYIPKIPDA